MLTIKGPGPTINRNPRRGAKNQHVLWEMPHPSRYQNETDHSAFFLGFLNSTELIRILRDFLYNFM
jgi:hypothetical protein